jgi:tetratricopeptide (TPR) repeat protein
VENETPGGGDGAVPGAEEGEMPFGTGFGTSGTVVQLDYDVDGIVTTASGAVRIPPELMNSDTLDRLAMSTNGAWILGLDTERDTQLRDYLERDFGERLVEVPGVGYCLLPEGVAPGSAAYAQMKAELLSSALNESPSDELYAALARTYAQDAGDMARADGVLDRWLTAGGDPARVGAAQGDMYRLAAQHPRNAERSAALLEEAASYYTRALAQSDEAEQSSISRRLADTYIQLDDPARARSVLEDMYWRGEVRDEPLVAEIGQLAYQSGDYDKALEWYGRIESPSQSTRMQYGRVLEEAGDPGRALEMYEAAAAQSTDLAQPVMHAALLYAQQKDREGYQRSVQNLKARMAQMTERHRTRVKQTDEYKRLKQIGM